MAVKTTLTDNDFNDVCSDYNLGNYLDADPIAQGSVQTNYIVRTPMGRFVFRYYENRSTESILFETNLIRYLKGKQYPCPAVIKNRHGKYVGLYEHKPYALFEFVEGEHIQQPDAIQRKAFVQKVAELHILTRTYRPTYKAARWNYSPALCEALATRKAEETGTEQARNKHA
jgi:homoserine kinase type II